MLSEEQGRGERARESLEAQRDEALEAEQLARAEAAETEAQRQSLESRLTDAQRIIEALIRRVGEPPESP